VEQSRPWRWTAADNACTYGDPCADDFPESTDSDGNVYNWRSFAGSTICGGLAGYGSAALPATVSFFGTSADRDDIIDPALVACGVLDDSFYTVEGLLSPTFSGVSCPRLRVPWVTIDEDGDWTTEQLNAGYVCDWLEGARFWVQWAMTVLVWLYAMRFALRL